MFGVLDSFPSICTQKWRESNDTIIEGQIASVVEKVVIRRKLGSVPVDENDGDLVTEVESPLNLSGFSSIILCICSMISSSVIPFSSRVLG